MSARRTSLATGMRHVGGNGVGGWPIVSVMLYDGAQAVPVHERWSRESMTVIPWSLAGSNGAGYVEAFVCCGPAAPLPQSQRVVLDAWERERDWRAALGFDQHEKGER